MGAPLKKSATPAEGAIRNPEFLQDLLEGLSRHRKSLPPKWLYDARGSALFEQITALPEYYLARSEASILRRYARFLVEPIPEGGTLVELGSGASTKTQLLLDAGPQIGTYVPIDISASSLRASSDRLKLIYPDLVVSPLAGDFTKPDAMIGPSDPSICFFPGSTIGNMEPDIARALLNSVRAWPDVRSFVLGVDLVKKPETLVAAYDDARGITAEFIGNILVRANSELDADFDKDAFKYRATWDSDLQQIDMWLVSGRAQTVHAGGEEFRFAEGEALHISASRKFTESSLRRLAQDTGWRMNTLLTDPQKRFAVVVLSTGDQ